MMETMENTIEEVEYKHLQLTSVLKSISHGILVIDIDGNIILINDEARKMIKSKCIGKEEGKNGERRLLQRTFARKADRLHPRKRVGQHRDTDGTVRRSGDIVLRIV